MPSDWAAFCRVRDLVVGGDTIDVRLPDGRHQKIRVLEVTGGWRLITVVARPAALERAGSPAMKAWAANRGDQLTGFRLDEGGRMVGEVWVPRAGLTADEFRLCVRALAVDSDRFEHVLTGRDVE